MALIHCLILKITSKVLLGFMILLFVQCDKKSESSNGLSKNGGLFLPDDFEAVVVVDSIEEKARHITVSEKGDVYVNLRYNKKGKSVAILRDTNKDGSVDVNS